MPPAGVTFDDVRARAGELPGTEASLCFGTPAIRVKGKFFYITDHYRDYPAILVRLSEIDGDQLADLLEMGWRFVAPKRLLAAFEAARRP